MSVFKNFVILALLFIAALPARAAGCSCLWQGNFTDLDLSDKVIVLGEVQSHRGNSMDLALSDVLKGQIFQDEIRVWGDNGSLCRADVDKFENHSQWLLVLEPIRSVPEGGFNPHTPNISYGRVGDYSLNRCGVYWLKYHNGYLSGNVDDNRRWLYLDKKKSPVKLALIKAFIEGRTDKALLAKAASSPEKKQELLSDTRAFLMQQDREEALREKLESLKEAD